MYESYILSRPWLVASIWAILYTSDYYLTLWGARLYRRQKFMAYEGSYELTPEFQEDVDRQRPLSIMFVVWLVLMFAFLIMAGSVNSPMRLYGFFVGLLIVPEIFILLRRVDNIVLFHRLSGPNPGASGSVRLSRRNAYIRSCAGTASFALLTLLFFFLTGSYVLLGGVLGLAYHSWNDLSMARRCPRSPEANGSGSDN